MAVHPIPETARSDHLDPLVKTLLLLRHGKSDWDAGVSDDHERPLAARGRRAASDIGRFLAFSGLVPDLVVTSTAVRASDTARRAAEEGNWTHVPVTRSPELYGAGPSDVLATLHTLPDKVERVLLVGHEPGWSSTVHRLTGGGDVRMPTGALARIDFDIDRWQASAEGRGILICLVPPRMLEGCTGRP